MSTCCKTRPMHRISIKSIYEGVNRYIRGKITLSCDSCWLLIKIWTLNQSTYAKVKSRPLGLLPNRSNCPNHQKRKIRNFSNFGPNCPKSPQRSKSNLKVSKSTSKIAKFAYFWRVPKGGIRDICRFWGYKKIDEKCSKLCSITLKLENRIFQNL